MSFFFKSSKNKQQQPPSALPQATRNLKSSEGPGSAPTNTTVPALNGVSARDGTRPKSPPNGVSANGSINSTLMEKAPSRSTDDGDASYEKIAVSPSPEQKSMRDRSDSDHRGPPQSRMPIAAPNRPAPDPSPYPWSQRQLTYTSPHANPFPRYGAAVNSVASRDGSVFIMGGLTNGSAVKGDLWIIEAGASNLTCYPVQTTSEGPGPRVGHASLLVGNAFIVFGGDTKTEESDLLDDTLYLLNTSTKQWSRAAPAGQRPSGRYGHTLNILGSKIYIFGGQVEGFFFNDLVAFDLNALQQASNRWETLIQSTINGGPPHGQIPPARTNHSMITWNDRLYLFGGTDGITWFNDVWSFDPRTNSWTQLECIGYIPSAREGHASALVGDVMYIFGGRTEEGHDLGDLAAFRISSRRWYTFQNMGPSPSPRSGHSMTALGKSIVILAGEPSSAPRDVGELSLAYFLDTSKIRYPSDAHSQIPVDHRMQAARRPSGEKAGIPQPRSGFQSPPRQLEQGPPPGQMQGPMGGQMQGPMSGPPIGNATGSGSPRDMANSGSRLPRAPGMAQQPQSQFAPFQQQNPQSSMSPQAATGFPTTRQPSRVDHSKSPSFENQGRPSTEASMRGMSPALAGSDSSMRERGPVEQLTDMQDEPSEMLDESSVPTPKPQAYQPMPPPGGASGPGPAPPSRTSSRALRREPSLDTVEPLRTSIDRQASSGPSRTSLDKQAPAASVKNSLDNQVPTVGHASSLQERERDPPVDSGVGSSPAVVQPHAGLTKELEAERSKNAWYASELALARKAGYAPSTSSPFLDEKVSENVGENDRPLVEALLKMRSELTRVQSSIEEQARSTSERIAQIEKQRDAAVNEAVFAKAKLAAHGGNNSDSGYDMSADHDRSLDLNRKLAASIAAHSELSKQLESLNHEKEAERQARQMAEESAETAHSRIAELDSTRQGHVSEMESLRTELHEAQRLYREHAASASEATNAHKLLQVDHNERGLKLDAATEQINNHNNMLDSLQAAVTASSEKADLLEQKLESERRQKDELHAKHTQLKAQHEESISELDRTTRQLQDAQELAEKHANEARTHRQAVLEGFGQSRAVSDNGAKANDERVAILQQQVESANALARQNQVAADSASEKLRRAEERIAGLEAYQEQSSREGLSMRKQLQTALRETRSLNEEKTKLLAEVQQQQLETNAITVQHSALKDILNERGVNATDMRKSRVLDSPSSARFGAATPDTYRVRELEQQLEASSKAHDQVKAHLDELQERDNTTRREYEEKLTALDNDHQAAVKYLRGTEKMLSKMKQELQRVKGQSAEYLEELELLRSKGTSTTSRGAPADWELEREKMHKDIQTAHANLAQTMAPLESQIATLQADVKSRELEMQTLRSSHQTTQSDLATLQSAHESSQADLDRLKRENTALEERARDAEKKVHLLLDQVENSVDNYRRQQPGSVNGSMHRRGISNASTMSTAHAPSHSRGPSLGNDSIYSQSITPTESEMPNGLGNHIGDASDDRSSLALDSLANELDALRNQWESSTRTYRLSDRLDFEKTPTKDTTPRASVVDWRRGLEDHADNQNSRENSPSKMRSVPEESAAGHHNETTPYDPAAAAAIAAASNAAQHSRNTSGMI
ncbi:hypothetical protein MBLNU457_6309t1 [Dothideomycetes sp. NU457]